MGSQKNIVSDKLPILRRLQNQCFTGRSSDLSHFRFLLIRQLADNGLISKAVLRITAAGTVVDLHDIPF